MEEKVCPWWIGYILASPLRKLIQNPFKILRPYIKKGARVLDAGAAMGFFTLPAAELTGPQGSVFAVDLQRKMLDSLIKRAKRKGLNHRITPIQCSAGNLNLEHLEASIDTALAIAVVHEVPDNESFFREIYTALKKKGTLIFCEPSGHVNKTAFEKSIQSAESVGFKKESDIPIKRSHGVVFIKN